MKTDQDITMAMRSGGDQNQHWGPRSMPQATDEDLDFEDPPPYVKDDMQRVFWCLSSKVRRVLQTHQHKPLVFCFHGGFCTFFMGDLAAAQMNQHFQKNPTHRISMQDSKEWKRLADSRRRLRDNRRWYEQRERDRTRSPSSYRGSSSSADSRLRRSPPPSFGGAGYRNTRSPSPRGRGSPNFAQGYRNRSPSPRVRGSPSFAPGYRNRSPSPRGRRSPDYGPRYLNRSPPTRGRGSPSFASGYRNRSPSPRSSGSANFGPGFRHSSRSRSPPGRAFRSRSPSPGYQRSPGMGHGYRSSRSRSPPLRRFNNDHNDRDRRKRRTPSSSRSPPNRSKRWFSPKTTYYPADPPGYERSYRRSRSRSRSPMVRRYNTPPGQDRHSRSPSPPPARDRLGPYRSSPPRSAPSAGSRLGGPPGPVTNQWTFGDRVRKDPPPPPLARRPPPRSYHSSRDYGLNPGPVGRFNSRKDPKFRDVHKNNITEEYVCKNRGDTKGCGRVFHNQDEYIEHVRLRSLPENKRNCPDYFTLVRECRDEGSIKGCGQKFNNLDEYQDHIKIRNRQSDRTCPGLEKNVKEESRTVIYTGPAVEIDIADSPEYVPPEESPSPPAVSPAPADTDTGQESEQAERAVSPPPCDVDMDAVKFTADGVILIPGSDSVILPDVVTSAKTITSDDISSEGSLKRIKLPPKQSSQHNSSPLPGEMESSSGARITDSRDGTTTVTTSKEDVSNAKSNTATVPAKSDPKELTRTATDSRSDAGQVDTPMSHQRVSQDSSLASVSRDKERKEGGKAKLPSHMTDIDLDKSKSKTASMKRKQQIQQEMEKIELALDKKNRGKLLKKSAPQDRISISERQKKGVRVSGQPGNKLKESKNINTAPISINSEVVNSKVISFEESLTKADKSTMQNKDKTLKNKSKVEKECLNKDKRDDMTLSGHRKSDNTSKLEVLNNSIQQESTDNPNAHCSKNEVEISAAFVHEDKNRKTSSEECGISDDGDGDQETIENIQALIEEFPLQDKDNQINNTSQHPPDDPSKAITKPFSESAATENMSVDKNIVTNPKPAGKNIVADPKPRSVTPQESEETVSHTKVDESTAAISLVQQSNTFDDNAERGRPFEVPDNILVSESTADADLSIHEEQNVEELLHDSPPPSLEGRNSGSIDGDVEDNLSIPEEDNVASQEILTEDDASKGEYVSTLKEALNSGHHSDTDTEANDSDDEDDDDVVLIFGKDSCDACPKCKNQLCMKEQNVSINITDYSYIVICTSCNIRIIIKNVLSNRQKSFLSCGV